MTGPWRNNRGLRLSFPFVRSVGVGYGKLAARPRPREGNIVRCDRLKIPL